LRTALPQNLGASRKQSWFAPEVRAEIARIVQIWTECRASSAAEGPLLFGHFTIADAMFAPVTQRFRVYGVPLEGAAADYVQAIAALPAVREWEAAAGAETLTVAQLE
jgi:glutathione S-transferase